MNKLEFDLGGHIVALDDIDYLQNAVRNAFQGLLYKNAILSGLRIEAVGSGPTAYYKLTAGYVSIAGEIFYFAGDNNWLSYADPVLIITEVNDTATGLSPVSYADGSSKQVHKKRTVVIEDLASQPAFYRIKDLEDYADPWHRVGDASDLFGGYASGTNYSDGTVFSYGTSHENLSARKRGRFLELKGSMQTNAYSDGQVAFNAPVISGHNTYIPKKIRTITVPACSSGDGTPDNIMIITFDVDGSIIVSKGTYSGSSTLRLHVNARIPLD